MASRSLLWPDPRVKPPFGAAEIDWGHPLSQGLALCVLANEGGGIPHDLVRPRVVTSGALWFTAIDGLHAYTFSMTNASTTDLDVTSGGWTVVHHALISSKQTGQYPAGFWRRNYVSEINNQGYSMSPFPTNDTDRWVWDVFNNNSVANYRLAGTTSPALGTTLVVGTSDGTTRRLYVNALEEANTTHNPYPAVNSTGTLQNASAGFYDARVIKWMFFSRCLPAADVRWLAAEPYAMLRPIVRRRYFVFHKVGPLIHAANPQLITAGGSLGGATL